MPRYRWIIFCLMLWSQPGLTQTQHWEAGAGISYLIANGRYEATRPNGKIIDSDLYNQWEWQGWANKWFDDRWGMRFQYFGSNNIEFEIHQKFPDDTEFNSSDYSDLHIVQAGTIWRFKSNFHLGMLLSLAFYSDISLESAGMPFDRSNPLVIDMKTSPGFGIQVGYQYLFSKTLGLEIETGLNIHRFHGTFATETDVDPVSEIDVEFNPLIISVGFVYKFNLKYIQ